VKKDDVADVVKAIKNLKEGDRVLVLVPFKTHANRDTKEELNILLQKGFSRIAVPSGKAELEPQRIEDLLENTKLKLSSGSYLLIDRLVVKEFDEDDIHRISDSVGIAFYEGEGSLMLEVNGKKILHFSNKFELDGIQFEEPVPNLFSFNNPFGACPTCEGFSLVLGIDPDLVHWLPGKVINWACGKNNL